MQGGSPEGFMGLVFDAYWGYILSLSALCETQGFYIRRIKGRRPDESGQLSILLAQW